MIDARDGTNYSLHNKHHRNQEHKKHKSMLQKTDAGADRSKRGVVGDSVKEGTVQEMGTS
jgi:hypothetical protein